MEILWKWKGDFRSSRMELKKCSTSEGRPFVAKISSASTRSNCISTGWTENVG